MPRSNPVVSSKLARCPRPTTRCFIENVTHEVISLFDPDHFRPQAILNKTTAVIEEHTWCSGMVGTAAVITSIVITIWARMVVTSANPFILLASLVPFFALYPCLIDYSVHYEDESVEVAE